MFAIAALVCLAGIGSASPSLQGQTIPASEVAGLKWRNIGPFRAGRVSAVCGIPGNPAVFYIGLPQGGVWKTTSAGQTWFPVFDGIRTTSAVGSIEAAPSDPSVVYAGTGEISGGYEGAGMYRSSDAGSTWKFIGLEDTKLIPALLVDPKNPNLVLAAAYGSGGAPNKDLGVFRTSDGGATWNKTLFINDRIGVQHLAWAYDNPSVVFALSMRRAGRLTGLTTGQADAPDTAIYKSLDEGQTWAMVVTKGLPTIQGRCTIAVAQNTNSQRLYLIGTFGLYRSDDGGANWQKMAADDGRIANGQGYYTSGVYVDPRNPDIVYTLATCSYRSLDGGKTFDAFKGAPGGDDPQQLWIDPTNGDHLLLGGDQGAVVSLDAGQTWGSWYNQPTGQFYHIAADNQWPYWIYGTQQDSGSIGTSSRGNLGEITPNDWTPHPGSEGGPMVADPLDPRYTYCQGPGGLIRVIFPSGQWTQINPAHAPGETLRGPSCILFSAGDPHELLAGAQYVLSSKDRGESWRKLSPDLSAPTPTKPLKPGEKPPTGNGAIFTISAAPQDGNIIWAGTSNGNIKVTRDHGAHWQDAAISAIPANHRGTVTCIEASGTNKEEAYVSISTRGTMNNGPRVYRTRDLGQTWTEIMNGLPPHPSGRSFAIVLRCDPKHAGLLFITTGSDLFYSNDDGDNWNSLDLNLPVTSYSDIVVHGDDLVLATYGRGLWILDNFSPLRDVTPTTASEAVHLFKPTTSIRVRRNLGQDTPFPPEVPHAQNPPLGVVIDYSLAAKPTETIMLEVLDRTGQVVRHMSSAPIAPYTDPRPAVPDFWFEPRNPLPTEIGLNRINWNVRYDTPPAFFHDPSYSGGAAPGDTPFATEGPLALPGTYTIRLTVDDKTYSQTATVVNDPRSPGTEREMEAMHDIQMRLYQGVQEAWDGYHQVEALRAEVAQVVAAKPSADVIKAASTFDASLAEVGGSTTRRGTFFIPTSTTNFVGIDQFLISALDGLDNGDIGPTEEIQMSSAAAWSYLKTLADRWRALDSKDLAAFNDVLTKNGLTPISAVSPVIVNPSAPPSRYLPPAPHKG